MACEHWNMLGCKNNALCRMKVAYCILAYGPSLLFGLSFPNTGSEVMLLSPELGGCSATDTVAATVRLVPVLIVTAAAALYEEGCKTILGRKRRESSTLGQGLVADYWTLCLCKTLEIKIAWKLQRLQMKTKDSLCHVGNRTEHRERFFCFQR